MSYTCPACGQAATGTVCEKCGGTGILPKPPVVEDETTLTLRALRAGLPAILAGHSAVAQAHDARMSKRELVILRLVEAEIRRIGIADAQEKAVYVVAQAECLADEILKGKP